MNTRDIATYLINIKMAKFLGKWKCDHRNNLENFEQFAEAAGMSFTLTRWVQKSYMSSAEVTIDLPITTP